MNFFHAVILGIVEGISEFLPISSTGHLILVSRLLGLAQSDFLKSFEISIQLGAIFSVIVLYWRRLLVDGEIFKRVMIAFVPTAIFGFILYKFVKKVLLGNPYVVLCSLAIGGLILILFELTHQRDHRRIPAMEDVSYATLVGIGLFQSLAIIPGVSRSAATIIGGLFLGVERKTIVEFSFLLAVPTMLAATALDLIKNAGSFSSDQFGLLAAGFITAFVVALVCIKGFLKFIENHSFIVFGFYRIFAALLFWTLIRS